MKKALFFLFTAILIFSLCACGKSIPAPAVTLPDASSDEASSSEDASAPDETAPADDETGTAAKSTGSPASGDAAAALEQRYIGLTEDALSWEYDEGSKTVTISGEGPMRDYLETEPEWYAYCDTAEHIVIEDGVTSVGPGAFEWFSAVTDVALGASVEFVGDFAFYWCWNLWSVNFPAELKYVGEGAFYNTILHSDSGFVFPEGLLYLGDGAFHSAFKESYVSIPASLTLIGENALSNCFVEEFRVSAENPAYTAENGILYDKSMTTLINYPADKQDTVYEIPESVTTILDESIQVTNTLEKIVIPAGVSFIDEGAIFWNYALTSVEVDANNQSYKSEDGVLFTKDGKTILCYPIASPAAEYTIPDGCQRIGMDAFGFAANLTALHIPEGLQEIGSRGLYGCTGISQLDFSGSLTKIEAQALNCCDALREIRYAGTTADWQAIEIEDNNEVLSDGSISIVYAG